MSVRITTSQNSHFPKNETDRGFIFDFIDANQVISLLKEKLEHNGGKVGIICNTIRNAQSFYTEISRAFPQAIIKLAHSSFLSVDRLHNDEELLQLLGKQSAHSTQPLIIIGTQVLEQSLDIDFDILFSEIAPMDSLLQRSGRLHRHEKVRLPAFTEPHFYVIQDNQETILSNRGSSLIYGDYRLLQSERMLNNYINKWISFRDISFLIQSAYDYYDSDMVELKAQWDLNEANRLAKSKTFMIAQPVSSRDKPIYGWLEGSSELDSDVSGMSRVRDGVSGPSIIAIFEDENKELYVPYYNKSHRKRLYISYGDIIFYEVKNILGSALTLPIMFNSLISTMESTAIETPVYPTWSKNNFLQGEIPIIFDFEGNSIIGNITLNYDVKQGLITRKGNNNG